LTESWRLELKTGKPPPLLQKGAVQARPGSSHERFESAHRNTVVASDMD